ncbi:MAG TPA: 16S rRNA (cytosine(967)-C(5))-methyltransferase RsmB [bacterium]|nr:16S rRNA (cytosine(967)-C(5))-methyltransferase RsmB [bacterium]HPN43123.1 16S rRNA (cytosine(967)-C(5))-methyltransferase RsmB [bacterium]
MNKSNKLPHVRSLALLAINRVEDDHAYTDLVLNSIFNDYDLHEQDRAFLSELVRGTIRWKKKLDWIVNQLLTAPDKTPAVVKRILWTGLYQIIYMSRTPDFAAVNESVELARHTVHEKWSKVVNGVLRTFLRTYDKIKYPNANNDPVKYLAVMQSLPEWMVQRWLEQFGLAETSALCEALNERPVLSIRVNELRIGIKDVEQEFSTHQVAFEHGQIDGFYRVHDSQSPIVRDFLESGRITVQDESAGLVARLTAPVENQVVFDLCAAPGGKSMHLAELAHDRALIISGDVNRSRAQMIAAATRRLGITSVHPLVADAAAFPATAADVVVLDAPCSGMGVLHKKPDIRWQRNNKDITELTTLQFRLLTRAGGYVKKNGYLIYSTCTIDKDENENLVQRFIKDNPQFTFCRPDSERIPAGFIIDDKYIRTWPHRHKMDGSFAVKLQKIGF